MKNLDMMDFNEFILCVQEIFKDKFTAINMQNVNKKKKNTIEFRLSNCVFYDKNELKRNTELYGKILQISKELADMQNNIAKSNTQLYKMMLYKKLIMENSEKQMVELFLNLMFDEPEIRKIYRNRYLSSLNLINLDKQKGIQNTINDLEFCQEKIILSSLLKLENFKTNNKQNNIFDER